MRSAVTSENGFNSFGRTGGEVISLADRIEKGAKPKVAKRRAQSFSEIEIILVLGALGKSAKDLRKLTIKLLDGVKICPEKVSTTIDNLLRKFVGMRESFQAAHEAGLIANIDPAKKAKEREKVLLERTKAQESKAKAREIEKVKKAKDKETAKKAKDKERETAKQKRADEKAVKEVEKAQAKDKKAKKAPKAPKKPVKAKKAPKKATKAKGKAKKGKKAKGKK